MTAVFKREFKACFTGIIGWLFMAVILALYGLYFFVYNLLSGYAYISYSLSSMAFIMLIAVPVLTMRILSEDRRNKTDQLTLTAPVSVWRIVLGKYLALAALLTIDMLIISITPLVLSLYGTVPMGESYTAILGFWLFGLTCIAIGVFMSGITESQIIAAISSFVVLFIGYMMPNICTLISEEGNLLTRILKCYDLYSPLGPFNAGTLDITSVVYFITIISIVLFLTVQIIEKRRWSMSVKRIALGAFSIVTIIAVIAAGVLINYGVKRIPTEYTSIDVTYNKMFALTKETKDYIDGLNEDVTIYVWQALGTADTTLAETLDRFADQSDRLQVKYISPVDNPTFYTAYTSEEPAANSLIVVGDKRSRIVSYDDIYVYSYDYQYYTQSIDAYDAEGQIVSAVRYVTMDSDKMSKVYVLEGHDESPLGERFSQAITKANITLSSLNLIKEDAVPSDCSLLIINGAMSDLSGDDMDKVKAYLDNGGNVLLTTSYDAGIQPNIAGLLGSFGITRSEGIVMDYDAGHIYSKVAYYLLPEVVDSIYTRDIVNGYVFAPFAAGLKIDDEENNDFDYTTLLVTSDEALTMAVGEDGEASEADMTDKGPFLVGIAALRTDRPGTLLVFGSMDIFTDEADSIVAGSNLTLFNTILSLEVSEPELTGDDVTVPVIPAKNYTVDNLVITSAVGSIVGVFIMLLLPIAMIATGIAIWASRRKL